MQTNEMKQLKEEMQLNEEKISYLKIKCEACEHRISIKKFIENQLKGVTLGEMKEYFKRAPSHEHEEEQKRNRLSYKQHTRLGD